MSTTRAGVGSSSTCTFDDGSGWSAGLVGRAVPDRTAADLERPDRAAAASADLPVVHVQAVVVGHPRPWSSDLVGIGGHDPSHANTASKLLDGLGPQPVELVVGD